MPVSRDIFFQKSYVTNACKSRYIFPKVLPDLCFLSYFLAFYSDILQEISLRSVEGSYTLCTDFLWIQVAVKGKLITKIFCKDSVNVVVYIFYMQLCFSLPTTLFFSDSEFSYHSSLRLCTTKVFFQ